jgi:putative ABC transport system permease protein
VTLRLALASLRRHTGRTVLAVLGVAIASAMLLDMVMLSTGLRESFRDLLTSQGFDLRLSPSGTLPFDTEATIERASEIETLLRSRSEIAVVSPVLGATVHILGEDIAVATFALGIDPAVQGDYELLLGRDVVRPEWMVANESVLRATSIAPGDTVRIAVGYDPQLRAFARERRMVVVGQARFRYLARDQAAVALPLDILQEMRGVASVDGVSLLMVRTRSGADADQLARWIDRTVQGVDAVSTREALARVDDRLSYFRQLSIVLGVVSLVVGFLLVTTLVTVSVNERIGEIAVMRAIGISRGHVLRLVALESGVISLAGAALGMGLGLLTSRYLNGILSQFPGVPASIDFFLFRPRAAWLAIGMLCATGVVAAIYPSWRAASLPIAATLREEAVA